LSLSGRVHVGPKQAVMAGPNRSVTISEVAEASGVGVGTVSRVINGAANVSNATRQRVLTVIEELGYRPSRLATGLALGATRSVAVLVPYLTRPSVVARLAGVLSSLEAEGFDSIVCNVEHPDQVDRLVHSFAGPHRVDGILLLSLKLGTANQLLIRDAGLPLAAVDVDLPSVPRVVIDDVDGGRLATAHLMEMGHRRIAFIGDSPNHEMNFTSSARRLKGYRAAHLASGAEPDPSLVRLGEHGSLTAEAMTLDLLASHDPPTAIFAASDTQALGVMRAAEKFGLDIPRQLSVVGFDDIEIAELVGLTTIRQPLFRSGVLGGQLISTLVRKDGEPVRRMTLPLELVHRSSTARPG